MHHLAVSQEIDNIFRGSGIRFVKIHVIGNLLPCMALDVGINEAGNDGKINDEGNDKGN
jgi:hypothetical protein